jgi:hypothetical protein
MGCVLLHYLITRPSFYYFRYILSFYPFLIILLSRFLYRFSLKSKGFRIGGMIVLLLIIGGNMAYNLNFITKGRGQYWEALKYMDKHSNSPVVMVSSNQGNATLIEFYNLFFPSMKIIYVPFENVKRFAPEWFIVYSSDKFPENARYFEYEGIKYRFERSFLCSKGGLMGFDWFLYHKVKEFNLKTI